MMTKHTSNTNRHTLLPLDSPKGYGKGVFSGVFNTPLGLVRILLKQIVSLRLQ